MNITNTIPLLVPILTNLFNVNQIPHWIDLICEPGHPKFIFYEEDLSDLIKSVLNQHLIQQSDPVTVITDIRRYAGMVPFESCPLLFLESGFGVRTLTSDSKHRKIIVTSAESYQFLNYLFINNEVHDSVFLVFHRSQLTVHYYNNFQRTHDRLTDLKQNPLEQAAHDLAGAFYVNEAQNEMELIFTKFVVSELNATHRNRAIASTFGLIYTHLMTISGMQHRHLFMHRTSRYRVLVPRLDEPKAVIFILLDPFDVETWMAYGVMILVVAYFRLCCTRSWNFRQYLLNLQDVIACVVLGSPIDFHHQLEQLIIGLFQLLSIVLMTAYESLVISFLLNPRFEPELDTIDQLNDSCCWSWALESGFPKFRHTDNCLSVLWTSSYVPKPSDRERFSCYEIDTNIGLELDKIVSHPLIVKHYRWSKLSLYSYPVMAIAYGGVGVVRWIDFYAGVFFAEAALYSFYQFEKDPFGKGEQPNKAIVLEDLLLLWVTYCCGIALSISTFVLEKKRRAYVGRSRQVPKNQP